jgi:hypothetical protein
MKDVVALIFGLVICAFRGRCALLAENLALRHQLVVYQGGISGGGCGWESQASRVDQHRRHRRPGVRQNAFRCE